MISFRTSEKMCLQCTQKVFSQTCMGSKQECLRKGMLFVWCIHFYFVDQQPLLGIVDSYIYFIFQYSLCWVKLALHLQSLNETNTNYIADKCVQTSFYRKIGGENISISICLASLGFVKRQTLVLWACTLMSLSFRLNPKKGKEKRDVMFQLFMD